MSVIYLLRYVAWALFSVSTAVTPFLIILYMTQEACGHLPKGQRHKQRMRGLFPSWPRRLGQVWLQGPTQSVCPTCYHSQAEKALKLFSCRSYPQLLRGGFPLL